MSRAEEEPKAGRVLSGGMGRRGWMAGRPALIVDHDEFWEIAVPGPGLDGKGDYDDMLWLAPDDEQVREFLDEADIEWVPVRDLRAWAATHFDPLYVEWPEEVTE